MKYSARHIAYCVVILIIGSALLNFGCTLASRKRAKSTPELITTELPGGKGDAYLFDVKIFQKGKKNSIRLDIYRSGDSLALFARGYLGKGVLKGIIFPESLLVYFPTENEFYSGNIIDVINGECAESFPFEKIIVDLFRKTPPEIEEVYGNFYINIKKETGREREYELASKKCPESIDIKYDYEEDRFIPVKAEYKSNDGSFKLKMSRRKQRLNIEIPDEKFSLDIPATAVRIQL